MRKRPHARMARAPMLTLAMVLFGTWPGPGLAQDRVPVRVGDHAGHGRVVFDWAAIPAYTSEQQGDRLMLRFPPGRLVDLGGARRPPRNMLAVAAEGDAIVFTLKPGVRARVFRIGNRVVVDALDPAPGSVAIATPAPPAAAIPAVLAPPAGTASSAVPRQASPAAARPEPAAAPPRLSRAEAARPAASAAAQARNQPDPAAPAAPAVEPPPLAIAAVPVPPVQAAPPTAAAEPARLAPVPSPAALPVRLLGPAGPDRAILLPYPAGTGAAVVRRGQTILVAIDSPVPLNLAALRNDPVFAGLEAEAVPGGMLLRLPLAAPAALVARREPTGWILTPTRAGDGRDPTVAGRAMALEAEGNPPSRLAILATEPKQVLVVADPESGMPLLLGLVGTGGQGNPVARRLPELDLLATTLGAAALARADRVTLRAGNDRFILAAAGARLALDGSAVQLPAAPAMTRAFDFPAMAPGPLLERVRSLQAGIAATAPLTRAPQRRAAAEAYLALGLPQEAQAIIGIGMAESPNAAADPVMRALSGIAALLAGRLPEAAPLGEAMLPDSDELTFWRAFHAAALGNAAAAAPGLGATLPLLLDYPVGLRSRLLQPVALALAETGASAPLERLLAAAPAGLDLSLARGILAEVQGRAAAALEAYDKAAQGRDRLARARALRRAIELRLATGRIDQPAAARALEATLLAWRGDGDEVLTRLRVAELRRVGGDPRGAMALLRETEPMFPERAAEIRAGISQAFVAALEGEAPVAAVAMFDAYPELLPPGEPGEQAVAMLAERLASLELTDRAATLLRQAAERAEGVHRASLGLRLATLRLGEGDAAAAQDALALTEVAAIPVQLGRSRRLVAARAEARRGRLAEARALLEPLGTEGLETLADLLLEAQDWVGAAAALGRHLAAVLPPAPAQLNEAQQRIVLRQAALLALAADEGGTAALRDAYAARLADERFAAAFGALTADPMRGLSDLPRLQQELQLFRSLPNRLEALRGGALVAR